MGVFPSTRMYGVTRGGTIVDIEERYGPDNDVLWCRKRHPSGVCQKSSRADRARAGEHGDGQEPAADEAEREDHTGEVAGKGLERHGSLGCALDGGLAVGMQGLGGGHDDGEHDLHIVELFELQSEDGPSLDAFRTGAPVVNQDLESVNGRWPRFGAKAIECDFRSVHALPMRLRGVTIGALSLFRTHEGAMEEGDVMAAQALADVATVAILHHRAASEAQLVNDQLNHALNSRIVIEQAKGVVAERTGLDMEQAFARLRHHALNHNQRLVDVAHAVVDGTLKPEAFDPPGTSRRP